MQSLACFSFVHLSRSVHLSGLWQRMNGEDWKSRVNNRHGDYNGVHFSLIIPERVTRTYHCGCMCSGREVGPDEVTKCLQIPRFRLKVRTVWIRSSTGLERVTEVLNHFRTDTDVNQTSCSIPDGKLPFTFMTRPSVSVDLEPQARWG